MKLIPIINLYNFQCYFVRRCLKFFCSSYSIAIIANNTFPLFNILDIKSHMLIRIRGSKSNTFWFISLLYKIIYRLLSLKFCMRHKEVLLKNIKLCSNRNT